MRLVFLALEFPRAVEQFCGISRGEEADLKVPEFFQKNMSSTRPDWIFSGIAQFSWVLVYDLGISTNGCHTILQSFPGGKLVF